MSSSSGDSVARNKKTIPVRWPRFAVEPNCHKRHAEDKGHYRPKSERYLRLAHSRCGGPAEQAEELMSWDVVRQGFARDLRFTKSETVKISS